jgi:hypothetical protein
MTRKRASVLRYTYIVCLVLHIMACLSCFGVDILWKQHFFLSRNSPIGGKNLLICEVSRSPTIRHTPDRTFLKEFLARNCGQRDKNTQETDIHVLSVIRNRDPCNRVAANIRLRAHCHRYRPVFILALLY